MGRCGSVNVEVLTDGEPDTIVNGSSRLAGCRLYVFFLVEDLLVDLLTANNENQRRIQ